MRGTLGCPVVVYDYDGTNSGCRTRPGPGMPPHSAFSRAHPAPEPAAVAVAVAASHTGPLSFRRPGPASAPLHHTGLSLHRPIYSSTYYIPVAKFRVRLSDGLHFSNLVCLSRAAPPSTVTSTSNKVSQDPIDRVVSPSSALVPGAGANGPQSYYCHCIIITNNTHSDHPG